MTTYIRTDFGKRLCEVLGLTGLGATRISVFVNMESVPRIRVTYEPDDERQDDIIKFFELCEFKEQ